MVAPAALVAAGAVPAAAVVAVDILVAFVLRRSTLASATFRRLFIFWWRAPQPEFGGSRLEKGSK